MVKNFVSSWPFEYKNKNKHHETTEQIKIAAWMKVKFPDCLFTIAPNDIKLQIHQAKILKSRGYRKGTPDFLIFEPRGKYHGAVIELKIKGNRSTTEEQIEFILLAAERGYFGTVVFGYDEAVEVIEKYLLG